MDNGILSLKDSIELLREENTKGQKETVDETKGTTESVKSLSKTVGELLDEFRGSRKDREEEKREAANRKGADKGGKVSKTSKEDDEGLSLLFGGGMVKGVLSILASIPVAVTTFTTGLVLGYGKILADIAKFLTPAKVLKSIETSLKNLRAAFVGGTRGVNIVLRNANGTFRKLNPMQKAVASLGKAFESMRKLVRNIGGRVNTLKSNIRTFGRNLTSPIRSFLSYWGRITGSVSTLTKTLRTGFSKAFKPVTTTVKKIIDAIKGFGSRLGRLARFFGVLGRFVALPLTIIIGIVDSVKGFIKGFNEQEGIVNKLLGGVLGAIGGFLRGFIGVPLDLIKGALAWVLEKFGMENAAQFLRSFSIAEIIGGVFDKLTEFFIGIKDMIIGQINADGEGIGQRIKNLIGTTLTLPYDLVRKAFAWIAGKLGFEQVQGFLEGFSFFGLFRTMVDGFLGLITGIGDFISEKIQAVKDFFADPPGIGEIFESVLSNVYSALMMPFNLINSAVDNIIELIGSFIPEDMFQGIRNVGGDILEGLKSVIRGILPDPNGGFLERNFAKLIPDWVYDFVGDAPPPKTETNSNVALESPEEASSDQIREQIARLDGIKQELLDNAPNLEAVERGEVSPEVMERYMKAQTELSLERRRLEAELQDRGEEVPERIRPETPDLTQRQLATAQLNVSEQERRDTERASTAVGVNAIDASQRTVNNNVNNNQTALLNPNMPAVDNLDRSWVSRDW